MAMIFDGCTGGAKRRPGLLDQHADVVVAEDMSFEPIQPAIALERIAATHALPDSIDAIHVGDIRQFSVSSVSSKLFPGHRRTEPPLSLRRWELGTGTHCLPVSSTLFDSALRLPALSTATTA